MRLCIVSCLLSPLKALRCRSRFVFKRSCSTRIIKIDRRKTVVVFDTGSFYFNWILRKACNLLGTDILDANKTWLRVVMCGGHSLLGWCASASQQAWSACGGWPVGGEHVIWLADHMRHTKMPTFSDRAPRLRRRRIVKSEYEVLVVINFLA